MITGPFSDLLKRPLPYDSLKSGRGRGLPFGQEVGSSGRVVVWAHEPHPHTSEARQTDHVAHPLGDTIVMIYVTFGDPGRDFDL
jgi:hypothetical protein